MGKAEGHAVRGVTETLDLHRAVPEPGMCAVRGRAVRSPEEGAERAPLSEEECVWWRMRVHALGPVLMSGVDLPIDVVSTRSFHLEEDGRRVRVVPDSVVLRGRTVIARLKEKHPRAFVDRRTPVTDRVRARFPTVREHLVDTYISRVKFAEWRFVEGTEITVTGWLTVDEATGEPVLGEQPA